MPLAIFKIERFFHLVFITVLCVQNSIVAQVSLGYPEVKTFSREIYKAQRQNWSVQQSPKTGFLYFANSKGLLEYDGGRWRLYESPKILRSVFVDSNGLIFTGALGEFGFWKPTSNGTLVYHSLRDKIKIAGFERESIWNILKIQEGILFQSFAYVFLLKNNGQISQVKVPGNLHFIQKVDNKVYVPTIDGEIFELSHGKLLPLPATKGFLDNKSLNSITSGPMPGQLLIGTNRGVYIYENQKFRIFNAELNRKMSLYQLNKSVKASDDLYVFGTVLNGLIVTDRSGKILYEINKRQGLINNTVLSMLHDREGNIWLGLDNGIAAIKLKSLFKHYRDVDGRLGAIFDAAWFKGLFYLATNQGLFVSENQDFMTFKAMPNILGQTWDLKVVDGQLICGNNEGTFLIDGEKSRKISDVTGGWTVKKLKQNPKFLIQGTYTRLSFFKKDIVGQWAYHHSVKNFLNPVRQIEEDKDGLIWINMPYIGISRIKLSADLENVEQEIAYTSDRFIGSEVNICMFRDTLFATTREGIYYFDKSGSRFRKSLRYDSPIKIIKLFGNLGQSLMALDENGNFCQWNGRKFDYITHFDKRKFVETSETIELVNAGKSLIFCLEDGFIMIDKKDLQTIRKKGGPGPGIRSFKVEGFPEESQIFTSENSERLSLSHKKNTVGFCFTPNTFAKPVQYIYRLKGLTQEWSAFTKNPEKWYYNLPPGRYQFEVKSSNGEQGDFLEFEIRPPWYWNPWAKTAYLLFILASVYWAYRLHLRNLSKQQAKLQEAHKAEVEQKKQEITKIRNQQLQADVIRKSEELANSTMNLIKKNELLTDIKENVVEALKQNDNTSTLKKIAQSLDASLANSQDWKVFETNFNQVHEPFLKNLAHEFPNLSQGDLRLAAYLRMNLSSKEIAQLLNITSRSVELKRYRLRKKLSLESHENLNEFMMNF